jgi:hypothetical protein
MKTLLLLTFFLTTAHAAPQTWKDRAQMMGCSDNYFKNDPQNDKKAAFYARPKSKHPFNHDCFAPSASDLKTLILYKEPGSKGDCKLKPLEKTPYGGWVKRQLKLNKDYKDAKGTAYMMPVGMPPSVGGPYYCRLPLGARSQLYDRFADKKACGEPEILNKDHAKDLEAIRKHL